MTARQEKLVTDNINLVYQITQNYRNLPNYEDIVAEGMLGLCLAAANFDEIRGNSFSTYAYSTILGKVLVFVRTDKVVKPSRKDGKYLKVCAVEISQACENALMHDEIVRHNFDDTFCFDELQKRLDAKKFEIVIMLYSGYKKKEICERFKCSQADLNKELRNIQKTVKNII